MKKHIKKKFLLEFRPTDDQMKTIEESLEFIPIGDVPKIETKEVKFAMVHTFDGDMVRAFPFNDNGITKWIPEPDPVLIYFNSAYNHSKLIKPTRQRLLEMVNGKDLNESLIDKLYEYFALSAGFITYLFTSLEAFTNSIIPDDFIFEKPLKNKTELYSKDQIERHLSFDIKVQEVLPKVLGKDFQKIKPMVYQHILNMKEFRDVIMHTKVKKDGHTPYDHLFKRSLKFKYEETLDAAAHFINFYKPGLIEDCPCSQEH